MQTTQEITNALKTQYDAIATRIAVIDKEQSDALTGFKDRRNKVVAEAAPLAQALRALGIQVNTFNTATGTVPKPMSQEAKDRIREGLKKAAERKRQAATTPATRQELLPTLAAPSAPAKTAAKATAPAKKAGARAHD